MNAPRRQAERLGQLTTALRADFLVLLRFDGTDHLNGFFECRIEALAIRADLDFAHRQMERHGISFHFRHAMGDHTLVLTDDVLAHESIGARPFKSYDGHHQADGEHFWDWTPERNITAGAIRLTDYNFKTPDAAMEAGRLGDAAHVQGQIESFDYPGAYPQPVNNLAPGQWCMMRYTRGLFGNAALLSTDLSRPTLKGHRERVTDFLMSKYGVV